MDARFVELTDAIPGLLTITSARFIFEPIKINRLVRERGFLTYQLNCNIKDIRDCFLEKNLLVKLQVPQEICITLRLKPRVFRETFITIILAQSKFSDLCSRIPNLKNKTITPKYEIIEPILQQIDAPLSPRSETDISQQTDAPLSPRSETATSEKDDKDGTRAARKQTPKPPPYAPKLCGGTSQLLANDDVTLLASCLPARQQSSDWEMLYSTNRHGVSLQTFLFKTNKCGPTILIVEDSKHYIFGAFTTESWHVEEGFFGTGNSFLFTLCPKKQIYKWTGTNNYIQLGREDSISVGEDVALWLNEDLSLGMSGHSSTFGNQCLASRGEFDVLTVEVWGFPNSFETKLRV